MAGAPDPYADIDFDEVQCESVKFSGEKTFEIENWIWFDFAKINEQTGLAVDEIKCLKVCSNIFDDNFSDAWRCAILNLFTIYITI